MPPPPAPSQKNIVTGGKGLKEGGVGVGAWEGWQTCKKFAGWKKKRTGLHLHFT